MNISDNDLRNTYNGMETHDLIKLATKNTLTENAQDIINETLKKRGIDTKYIENSKEKEQNEIKKENEFYEKLASRWTRLYAKAIDIILACTPIFIASRFNNDLLLTLTIVLLILYIGFSDGIKGQSIGKRIANIIVVKQITMMPCDIGMSALRNLMLIFIGKIDILFALRKNKKRLGDSLAGTIVIKKV